MAQGGIVEMLHADVSKILIKARLVLLSHFGGGPSQRDESMYRSVI